MQVDRERYPKSENWLHYKLKITAKNGYDNDQFLKEDISGANALYPRNEDESEKHYPNERKRILKAHSFSPVKIENGYATIFMKVGGY